MPSLDWYPTQLLVNEYDLSQVLKSYLVKGHAVYWFFWEKNHSVVIVGCKTERRIITSYRRNEVF